MNTRKIILDIIDANISSLFDSNPAYFKKQHEKGVKPVRKTIEGNSINQLITLKKPLIRNAFLCGCLDFTENLEVEYLIIGHGVKRGIGTDISQVEYVIGDNNSVKLDPRTEDRLSRYVSQAPKNEVIIFHNHPKNWINIIFDNLPLPSQVDRNTLLRKKLLEPIILFKTLLNKGSIRFYLGNNGFVREYNMPNISQLLDLVGIKPWEKQKSLNF